MQLPPPALNGQIQMSVLLNFQSETSPLFSSNYHRPRIREGAEAEMSQHNVSHVSIPGQQSLSKDTAPFFILPPEIHLKIFTFLNNIDGICLSLTCTYFYGLEPSPPYPIKRSQASGRFRDVQPLPLETGSPYLRNPVIQTRGCKFCVPVLYYPAHCELHFHIREFIPENMRYCGECGKFTRSLAEKKYPTAIRAGNAGLRPAPLDVTPGLGANTLPVLTLEDRVTRIEGRVRELRESDERWPNSSSQLEFTPVDAAPVLLATDVPVEDALIELSDRIRRLEGRTVRERDAKERLSGSSGQQPTNTPSSQHSPRSKTALWELTSSDGRSAICGRCSVPYMQRYEGGRRMLNTRRPGQKLRVWYNREEEEDE